MESLSPTGPTPARPPSSPVGASPLGTEWPAQVAGTIDSVVTSVRDKTVKPATLVAKGLVYLPILAVVGVAVAIMLAVAIVRALNEIPGFRDWISLLAVGGLFTLVGLLSLRRGRSAGRSASKR